MPKRATKRGEDRTPLTADADVLICGASFAGLAVARELAGSGAKVMIIDRYEVGEKQTSACGIPTVWLHALDLMGSFRQEFDELVMHTPSGSARWPLPWTFSTFDYRELCALLWQQSDGDATFETAKVDGCTRAAASANGDGRITVGTDRGDLTAPLVVDGLGWRRILGTGTNVQPPEAFLSRGLEVHPHGSSEDLEIWIDRKYVPRGYGWSFPARDEIRIGVGSFDPHKHVKDETKLLSEDLGQPPVRYQGNWIPHKLRPAADGGVFFAGDSAGHCIPTTAEGIRTALYFGIAAGREIRKVVEGQQTREQALQRYAAFSASHLWQFTWMLRVQNRVPDIPVRMLGPALKALDHPKFVAWAFNHYLNIAHPSFVETGRAASTRAAQKALVAA